MRLLLDTHALIWWALDPSRLGRAAEDSIGDPDNEVLVSAISALEIATKHRLGKLPHARVLAEHFEEQIADRGFLLLDASARHCRLAGSLTINHRDPFDRVLIAQSIIEDAVLVSNERVFDSFMVRRLW